MDDIYDQLENYDEVNIVNELKTENKVLKENLEINSIKCEKLQTEFDELSKEYKKLELNYSSLLKTARAEIKRQAQTITNLNIEKDAMVLNSIQNKGHNPFELRQQIAKNVQRFEKSPQRKRKNEERSQAHLDTPDSSVSKNHDSESESYIQKETKQSMEHNMQDSLLNAKVNKNDAKENTNSIYEKKTYPKSIKDRRKSMPLLRSQEPQFSDEDQDLNHDSTDFYRRDEPPIETNPRDFLQNSHDYKSQRQYQEKYYDRRSRYSNDIQKYPEMDYRHKDSNYRDRNTNYKEKAPNYRERNARYNERYNNYKEPDPYSRENGAFHREKDYENSQRHRKHDYPDQNYKRFREEDNNRSRNKFRVLRSPTPDKYHNQRNEQSNRHHYENDYGYDKLDTKYREKQPYKRSYEEFDEPSRKRFRSESTTYCYDQDYQQKEISVSPAITEILQEDILNSCQSPEYIDRLNHGSKIREIKLDATGIVEDPRLKSDKYIINKENDKVVNICTKSGQLVNIVPAPWRGDELDKRLPEALLHHPDDLINKVAEDMYYNYDIICSATETGEVTDSDLGDEIFKLGDTSHKNNFTVSAKKSNYKDLDAEVVQTPEPALSENKNTQLTSVCVSTKLKISRKLKDDDVKKDRSKDKSTSFSKTTINDDTELETKEKSMDFETLNSKINQQREIVAQDLELSEENSDNLDLHKTVNEKKKREHKSKKKSKKDKGSRRKERKIHAETNQLEDKQGSNNIKEKFCDLFGESNSLITPEDLAINTPVHKQSGDIVMFEDAQDPMNFNVKLNNDSYHDNNRMNEIAKETELTNPIVKDEKKDKEKKDEEKKDKEKKIKQNKKDSTCIQNQSATNNSIILQTLDKNESKKSKSTRTLINSKTKSDDLKKTNSDDNLFKTKQCENNKEKSTKEITINISNSDEQDKNKKTNKTENPKKVSNDKKDKDEVRINDKKDVEFEVNISDVKDKSVKINKTEKPKKSIKNPEIQTDKLSIKESKKVDSKEKKPKTSKAKDVSQESRNCPSLDDLPENIDIQTVLSTIDDENISEDMKIDTSNPGGNILENLQLQPATNIANENDDNVVKTVVISSGVQTKSPPDKMEVLKGNDDKMSKDNVNNNLNLIKHITKSTPVALATSTPHKSLVEKSDIVVNCNASDSLTGNENVSIDQSSNSNACEDATDVPDVRLVFKRRKRPLVKRK